METAIAVAEEKARPFPVWHTAAVLGALAALVGLSVVRPHGGEGHRLVHYVVAAAFEWGLTGWILMGCRMRRESVWSLLGEFTASWRTVLRDCGLAIGFLVTANVVLGLLGRWFGATTNGALRNLLPRTAMETAAYLCLTVTAAFCEELIYRGYLQRQFTAWTGSAGIGLVLQGIVFGACHAYQGRGMMLPIAVYGCLFGLLAMWRRSLRPGMIAHLVQDAVGGLALARTLLK